MTKQRDARAFPSLDADEMALLAGMARRESFADGDVILRVGQADIDFFVIESGKVEMFNPSDGGSHIVTHEPGEFIGDIDMLTRRPIIVTGVARGPTTVLRVPGKKLRLLLNTVPRLGEKLLVAFQVRRQLLAEAGELGLKVIGPGHCKDTTLVREFLHKNFVPFTWYDPADQRGQELLTKFGSPRRTPVIECGDGSVLVEPSLRDLARCAGVWQDCPDSEFDLAIIGAGPAGIAAAVYAASEGLKTIVLDRLGPGGQVGGSSLIENFIGFPAGLSGNELATRGVLQMLKFGAKLVAPVSVDRLEPGDTPNAPVSLHLDCGSTIGALAVLVATGVTWRKLNVPGSQRFERAGIYHACTVVEATLHEGTDVCVVGAGNSAGQAAMFLSEYCARTVHLLVRRDTLGPGMSDYLAARIRATKNIVVHTSVEISQVLGEARLEGVELKRQPDGTKSHLDCSAIFVFIGAEPHGSWLPTSIARDKLGYLLTGADALGTGNWPLKDRDPCPLETTLPRVMAAGDVRAGSTKRVGFAVGDGSLAVTCVHKLKSIVGN